MCTHAQMVNMALSLLGTTTFLWYDCHEGSGLAFSLNPCPGSYWKRVRTYRWPCRVFCVSDEVGAEKPGAADDLVAVAEISLQVPNGKTAPPFPLPLWVKRVSDANCSWRG